MCGGGKKKVEGNVVKEGKEQRTPYASEWNGNPLAKGIKMWYFEGGGSGPIFVVWKQHHPNTTVLFP